jgi:flap endonuclease-1
LGVQLQDIIQKRKVNLSYLSNRSIAIDAHNALYQFLSAIRGTNGVPLKNRRGEITSHLSGLFYRSINFMETGIKPIYVFDGKPPRLKKTEIERRKSVKEQAIQKYEKALEIGDFEEARIHAQATSRLNKQMIKDSKRLLTLMGIPNFQAPSEGEAQAAYMASIGDVWATGSQDFDSLLFGTPRLIRNLTISGRRKLPRKKIYISVSTELISLKEALFRLHINRRQLIALSMLVGTDFNPNGIKGVGPKTALKLVKQFKDIDELAEKFLESGFPKQFREIENIFLNPNVTSEYDIVWEEIDFEGVLQFLCDDNDFSEERVKKALKRINKWKKNDTRLEKWF